MEQINSTLPPWLTQCFFFPVKIKSARESHFGPFFQFFHGQNSNFTPTFWPFFGFFHGEEIHFHGHKFDQFCEKVSVFTGYFANFFHVHQIIFTGMIFCKISRVNFSFHGDFFKIFQTFSRVRFLFSRGKKQCRVKLHACPMNMRGYFFSTKKHTHLKKLSKYVRWTCLAIEITFFFYVGENKYPRMFIVHVWNIFSVVLIF